MKVVNIRYEDQTSLSAGDKRYGAQCPFCGAVAKAYINRGVATFIGDCDHFVAEKANIIEATFEKEEDDEQNDQG